MSGQPAKTALLALAERHPILDTRILERMQKVLRLKRQVALQDEHALCVRKNVDAPNRANVLDQQPVRVAHVARVQRLDAQYLRSRKRGLG